MSKAERDAYRAQTMKRMRIENRAHELRPRRRDEPLRYLNISDDEVREIQLMAEKYLPKVLLNISPVVTGCPCEEGPQCTDQVYIVAETRAVIERAADVTSQECLGCRERAAVVVEARRARRQTGKMGYEKYESAMNELVRDFPMCVGELVPAENTTASTPKAETEEMTKKRASITVRPVKPEDHDAWRPLWDEYNVFYERTGPTALSEEMNDTLWRRFFDASEPVHCIVAEREHKVVGICHYLYHRSTSRMELLCYLQDLFTAPDYRGHGIGRALIERVTRSRRRRAASACTGRRTPRTRPAARCTTRWRSTSVSSSTPKTSDARTRRARFYKTPANRPKLAFSPGSPRQRDARSKVRALRRW